MDRKELRKEDIAFFIEVNKRWVCRYCELCRGMLLADAIRAEVHDETRDLALRQRSALHQTVLLRVDTAVNLNFTLMHLRRLWLGADRGEFSDLRDGLLVPSQVRRMSKYRAPV